MPILKNYIEGTQLNQLKYSSFNSGRGPIVQKKIPTGISEKGNSGADFTKRADDLARITALMTRPEGLNYLSNEKTLSAVPIKGAAQQEGKKTLLNRLVGGTLNTVKVLGSTLAQVPLSGTGVHFVKGFAGRSGYLGRTYAGEVKNGGKVNVQLNSTYPQAQTNDIVSENAPLTFVEKTSEQIKKESLNLENRIGLGDISYRNQSQRLSPYEKSPKIDKLDRKNYLSPTTDNLSQGFDKQTATPGAARDMVKFRFEVIEASKKPVNLYFRAFIDSFDDDYSSSWNEFQYAGRGETMYNYLGFNRAINVSFKSAAMTRHELAPMYRKLNYLASSLAPSYNIASEGSDGFMRGTLINFTLGSYFYRLPGFITSLNYSWNNTYPFEIALNSPDPVTGLRENDTDVQELPMVLDINMSYTPIHRFTPQTGYYHYTTNNQVQPFFKENTFEEYNSLATPSQPPIDTDFSKKISDINIPSSEGALFKAKYGEFKFKSNL